MLVVQPRILIVMLMLLMRMFLILKPLLLLTIADENSNFKGTSKNLIFVLLINL